MGSGAEVSDAAAARGWHTAVVESGPFGGTCLNRGCIPSKMLVHMADVARTVRRARHFGIEPTIDRIDWDFIVERVFFEIDADAAGIEEVNRRATGIEVVKGEARFLGPKLLEVVDGRRLTADRIVLAAGSRPGMPRLGTRASQARSSTVVGRCWRTLWESQPSQDLVNVGS
jgi:pyruvate/2-oxoglutarate dehydrogenase complex dihydrolipoamide dehydrogenase (E3) component